MREHPLTVSRLEQPGSLIAQADQAMARGDIREAASLLEVAAQRGRDSTTLLRLSTVQRSLGDLLGSLQASTAGVELSPRNFLMCLLLGSLREATGAIHAAQRAYRAACATPPRDLSFNQGRKKQVEWGGGRVQEADEGRRHVVEWDPAGAGYNLSRDE